MLYKSYKMKLLLLLLFSLNVESGEVMKLEELGPYLNQSLETAECRTHCLEFTVPRTFRACWDTCSLLNSNVQDWSDLCHDETLCQVGCRAACNHFNIQVSEVETQEINKEAVNQRKYWDHGFSKELLHGCNVVLPRSELNASVNLVLGRHSSASPWFQILQSNRAINPLADSILANLEELVLLQVPVQPESSIQVYRNKIRISGSCQYNMEQNIIKNNENLNERNESKSWVDVSPLFVSADIRLLKINWNLIENPDTAPGGHPLKIHWNCSDTEQGIIYTNKTEVVVRCENHLLVHILSSVDELLVDPIIWEISNVEEFWNKAVVSNLPPLNPSPTGLPATISLALVLTALVVSLIMLIILLRLYSASDYYNRNRKSSIIRVGGPDVTIESGISILDSTNSVPLSFERFVLNHRLMNFNGDHSRRSDSSS